jgi:hypothetical protein
MPDNIITQYLLTARNILNVDEVEEYIKSLVPKVDSKIGKRWIMSNLKNYILKKMDANEVRNYKSSKRDSTQIQKAVEYNETIYKINLDHSFKTEVNHIVDYINSLEPLQLKKIIQKPFPILNKQAKESTENEAKRLKRAIIKKGTVIEGLKLIKEYGSASLVQLVSWPQFQKETADLHTCIGQQKYKHIYYAKHLKDKAQYYSLRVHDKAVGSIEVDRKKITQIKGYRNGEIETKYHEIFQDILLNKRIDYNSFTTRGNDLKNIGAVLFKNKIFRINDPILRKKLLKLEGNISPSIRQLLPSFDFVVLNQKVHDIHTPTFEKFLLNMDIEKIPWELREVLPKIGYVISKNELINLKKIPGIKKIERFSDLKSGDRVLNAWGTQGTIKTLNPESEELSLEEYQGDDFFFNEEWYTLPHTPPKNKIGQKILNVFKRKKG